MKPSDFKKHVDALARFADVRAKPDDVRSKIGVQVDRQGSVTLIATNSLGGMLVRLTGDEAASVVGPYAYYIEAKPVLQAAKIVKGRMDITFNVSPDSFEIVTGEGGRVKCRAMGPLSEAGFLPKPKGFVAKAIVYAEKWEQLSRIEPAITKGEGYNTPTIELVGGSAHIVMTGGAEKHSYASLRLEGSGESGARAAIQHDLVGAFKALSADGILEWGPSGLSAKSGRSECWSAPYKVSAWDAERQVALLPADPPAWPIIEARGSLEVEFTIDRMSLVEVMRGLSSADEYGRFTMEVGSGNVKMHAYGIEDGFTVPAKTNGNSGVRSASAEYMVRVLRGLIGKSVTVGWNNDQPAIVLRTPEMSGWTVLLAPVVLS